MSRPTCSITSGRLGASAQVLNGRERLQVMHDMVLMGDNDKFIFDWKWLPGSGLSVKDFIAPTSFSFPGGRTFTMGPLYGAMSFLSITASDISDQLLRELLNAFPVTDDDIIVCDPESEYTALVERLDGQVVRISTSSNDYINPMDINSNYSEDDDSTSLKVEFILSLCDLVVGGKEGLLPVEKTVIDRCVHKIYRRYFENPVPENMPILENLYNALLEQEESEARHVATALEIYVKGSLNLFNHRTNVDINKRIVCFDIRELGKQLKKIGMLIVQNAVWNRVTAKFNYLKSA